MSANLFEKVTTVSFEKPPKVSVIMPYHNEGDLLARSLQSVFDQEVDFDVEIVLIDDCSDLKPKLPSSPRFPIQHLRTTSNVYAGQARNIGIGECHGELICFLDSDDEYAAGRLSSAVEFLDQHPEVDFVFCSFYIHRGGPNLQVPQAFEDLFEAPPPPARGRPAELRWDVVKKYAFHPGCITARRDLLVHTKFD
ncbi:MAG: glycosyltransferase family 2 protein, partial [Gemmataceae bacterium]